MTNDSEKSASKLQLSLSPKTREHLRTLIETGAFGATEAEIVKVFAHEGIRKAYRKGFIPKKPGGI